MRRALIGIALMAMISFGLFSVVEANAARTNGYYRSNGTYVQPYYRTSPNSSRFDNYSTKGNYNPYTGKSGYKNIWKW